MSVKLQSQSVIDALESFMSAFTEEGHAFTFTSNLSTMVSRELFDEEDEDEIDLLWPFETEKQVHEVVLTALDNLDYQGKVEVFEFESDTINWTIIIEAKTKETK